jgi:hypothetical protein
MRALYHDYLDTLRKMMAVEKPTSAARKNLPALIISKFVVREGIEVERAGFVMEQAARQAMCLLAGSHRRK